MANKVVIGILVLLAILMGGFGYYTYTLSQQIDSLGEQLTTFETEQTARVDAISDELFTLRNETTSSINALEGKIGETLAEIDTLQEELGATQNRIAGLESDIGGVTSQVESLEDRLTDTVIDASEVYQKVRQATVRISDGQITWGSGVIYDTDGHVITNHHVVERLSEIYVILHDGRISKATTVGSCQISDIAVLEMEDNPAIEPPPLADSRLIEIGEPVIALGSPGDIVDNPLGLTDTLTSGIISQVNRIIKIQSGTEIRSVPNLLQFDAAINFGNSGGPLANSDGEVIGIVIARISPTEGDGIYYAVSANKARQVATTIIEQGYFDYPWVGTGILDLTPQIVQDRNLETSNGVLVGVVSSDGPAEAAGIKVDDIIVAIDGVSVKDMGELTSYLGEFKSPGDAATISLIRGSTEIELSIEVGKREE